jgi:hypothetical protein
MDWYWLGKKSIAHIAVAWFGISINPEDAVIIGVLTGLYSDGRTEDVEL